MKKRTKKLTLLSLFSLITVFLSGCVRLDSSGNPTGWFYDYLVVPTQAAINGLAGLVGDNYGWAIIIFTIVFKILILPLSIRQQKSATKQQVKMKSIEHITKEIQEEMQEAQTQEEQMRLQNELQEIYKELGISVTGGMGCLPLLIQLPIITMVYSAIRYSPNMAGETFLGIPLGERSILLAVIVGIIYLAQAYFMMMDMPKEQRKQMLPTALMNPIMIFVFSLSSPGGVALYWVVSGILAILQSLYSNKVLKPKIEAEAKEEIGDVKITRKPKPKKRSYKAKRNVGQSRPSAKSNFDKKSSGRNAGKQQRRK